MLPAGLLAIQSSNNLTDVSGYRNLERVGTLVIGNMGNKLPDLDGFNSLSRASYLIITRNQVRECTLVHLHTQPVLNSFSLLYSTWRGFLGSEA